MNLKVNVTAVPANLKRNAVRLKEASNISYLSPKKEKSNVRNASAGRR